MKRQEIVTQRQMWTCGCITSVVSEWEECVGRGKGFSRVANEALPPGILMCRFVSVFMNGATPKPKALSFPLTSSIFLLAMGMKT